MEMDCPSRGKKREERFRALLQSVMLVVLASYMLRHNGAWQLRERFYSARHYGELSNAEFVLPYRRIAILAAAPSFNLVGFDCLFPSWTAFNFRFPHLGWPSSPFKFIKISPDPAGHKSSQTAFHNHEKLLSAKTHLNQFRTIVRVLRFWAK